MRGRGWVARGIDRLGRIASVQVNIAGSQPLPLIETPE